MRPAAPILARGLPFIQTKNAKGCDKVGFCRSLHAVYKALFHNDGADEQLAALHIQPYLRLVIDKLDDLPRGYKRIFKQNLPHEVSKTFSIDRGCSPDLN